MSARSLLRITNFTPLSEATHISKEEMWRFLESEILLILNTPIYPNCLEKLYRTAEDLYTQNYPPLLVNLHSIFKNHLEIKLEVLSKENHTILHKLDEIWREYYRHINIIRNIFLRFDRSSRNFKYNTVQGVAIVLFNNVILMDPDIKMKLLSDLLHKITVERKGVQINRNLMKSVIEMFNTLQIYDQFFLGEFLSTSRLFYEDESYQLIYTLHTPEYLKHVQSRIDEENDRIEKYLNQSSKQELLNIVHEEFIGRHSSEILDRGFDDFINGKNSDELNLMYEQFSMISHGIEMIMGRFNTFVLKRGVEIAKTTDKTLIEDLVCFKDDLEQLIKRSFHDNPIFYESIKANFKKIIATANNKIAQLLAKFVDSKLRSKDLNDGVLEETLIKVVTLFKFVQGKDIFLAFYKRYLAKRLLLSKSSSQDAENFIISKLKEECGDAFTSHIEGMFQDMNLSKDINFEFRQRVKSVMMNNNDFTVNVLTSSYWPNYPVCDVHLPIELVSYQQSFQGFYLTYHSGRKLLWQPILGHCLIKAAFDSGSKELQVSLFQALILLIFNDNDKATLKDIQEHTNLERSELLKNLTSLVFGKARILLKNSPGKDLNDDDIFTVDCTFNDKLHRVRVNQIQFQESLNDEEETEKHVLVDRQFQIDAAIVRILKDKKKINHNTLIKELYGILDIPISQTDLKKRIELLIDREYLERDKNYPSIYIYVA